MNGTVTSIHTRKLRRARMGYIDPALVAAGAAALQSQGGGSSPVMPPGGGGSSPVMPPGGGGSSPVMPPGGGSSNMQVPVTTQVTTAVSPVFNIAAGNQGGGPVSQSGTTSQSASPSAANMFGQPGAGQPGGSPFLPDSTRQLPGGTVPTSYPYSGTPDGSFTDQTSLPSVNYQPASGGMMRPLLIAAIVGLGAWFLLSPKGKQTITRIYRPSRKRRKK